MLLKSRVRMGRDVDLSPHTTLKAGETGSVVRLVKDALGVYSADVLMDRHHAGLAEWGNEAHLMDPELGAVIVTHILRCNLTRLGTVALSAMVALAKATSWLGA